MTSPPTERREELTKEVTDQSEPDALSCRKRSTDTPSNKNPPQRIESQRKRDKRDACGRDGNKLPSQLLEQT